MMHVGQRIRQAREEAGLVQEELARTVGVSQRSVSYVERQPWVKLSTLERYAKALARPLGYFVKIVEEGGGGDDREEAIERAFEVVCRDPEYSFGARGGESLNVEIKRDIVRLYESCRQVKLLPEEVA